MNRQAEQTATAAEPAPPGPLGRIGLRHPRTWVPLGVALGAIAMLTIERAALLAWMPQRFADAGASTLVWSFLVGLRFDAVIGCMIAAPLLAVLIPAPPPVMNHRWFRRIVAGYCGAALALVLVLCIGDALFFQEFGQRLNHQVFEYVNYDYVWLTLWDQYPLVPTAAAFLVGAVAFGWLFARFGFRERFTVAPIWQTALWPAVSVAVVVLAIRGSVGPKPINTGPAYFSGSPAVTQLTLNGAFTLREAAISRFVRTADLSRYHETVPEEEAMATARKLVAGPNDRFVGDERNPLRRVTDTGDPRRRPNIVLLIMESISWHYVGSLGGDARLTPNLDRLANNGILFDRCFAVGGRTTHGVSGILSGFPDLPGESVTTRSEAEGNFLTLGSILADRGYETMFIYGGQPHYDHRRAFLGSNGFNRFVFEDEFATTRFRTHLGWLDGDLLRTAHQVFSEHPEGRPFFATLLTLAFHRPYHIPPDTVEPVAPDHRASDQLTAVRYTDWAIGRFLERARQADYFDNTVFVFVADHAGGFRDDQSSPVTYRVPFLVYGPGVIGTPGRRVSTVCSQTDIPPTLLSMLGGRYEHCFFGSNVLAREKGEGHALLHLDNHALGWVAGDGTTAVIPPHEAKVKLHQFALPDRLDRLPIDTPKRRRRADRMQRRAVSTLQAAKALFERGAYQLD